MQSLLTSDYKEAESNQELREIRAMVAYGVLKTSIVLNNRFISIGECIYLLVYNCGKNTSQGIYPLKTFLSTHSSSVSYRND